MGFLCYVVKDSRSSEIIGQPAESVFLQKQRATNYFNEGGVIGSPALPQQARKDVPHVQDKGRNRFISEVIIILRQGIIQHTLIAMSDFLCYYRKFVAHWGNELLSFGREQIVGITLAVLILFFQIHKGLIPAKEVHDIALATIFWPYIGLICIYLVIHWVRTPWQLEKQQREIIKELSASLHASGEKANVPPLNLQQEWKELATRFEKISPHVRADWQCQRKENRTVDETWRLAGLFGETVAETLCRYAGTLLAKSPSVIGQLSAATREQTDPVWRWLFFLKDTSPHFYRDPIYGTEADGTIYLMGGIRQLASASATACIECATAEIP